MHWVTVTIAMLVCFQVKHYIADYVLQPGWVLRGKGDIHKSGGYIHAGVHIIGSLPALLIAGLGVLPILAFLAIEFAIHYAIDFTKSTLSAQSKSGPNTMKYWAMHGADQLAHQLTYAGLIFAALSLTVGQSAQ